MPIKTNNGFSLTSNHISGGIEKFAKQLIENIDGIIPLEITEEDRKQRRTRQKIERAILEYNPDCLIANDFDNSIIGHDIPTILIFHVGDERYIALTEFIKSLNQRISVGLHIYFVSNEQLRFHNETCQRLTGEELRGIKGFIDSSYCEGNEAAAEDIISHCTTIGRTDPQKNPFLCHKLCKPIGVSSVVITTLHKDIDRYRDYLKKNEHWNPSQITFRDIAYDNTMEILSKSGSYMSTCPLESWGITAMEALARGVPLLLVKNKYDSHASTEIAASENHYELIDKNEKSERLKDIIYKFNRLTYEERVIISDMTKEKHHKLKWIQKINDVIDMRLSDKKIINNFLKNLFF